LRTSPNQQNVVAAAILPLATILANISVSIQNCNSLNVSTNCPKQLKKLSAITSLGSKIIFLSDICLNNSPNIPDIERCLLTASHNPYKFFFNSTGSRRGVGILISDTLDYSINSISRDNNENIICVNISLGGHQLNLISVYGPNRNCPEFIPFIEQLIRNSPTSLNIIGGDWNCTYSTDDTVHNLDIINMVAPPNIPRSRAIAGLCDTFQLMDPYRAHHPDLRDYTYVPRIATQLNRSRLDFF